jgi:hypothetical protein
MSYWRRSGIAFGERIVQGDAARLHELEDRGGGEDHLGERGEVEPGFAEKRLAGGLDLGRTRMAHRALAGCEHDPEHRAGDAALGNRVSSGTEGLFGDGFGAHAGS